MKSKPIPAPARRALFAGVKLFDKLFGLTFDITMKIEKMLINIQQKFCNFS